MKWINKLLAFWPFSKRSSGNQAENIACRYLKSKGLKLKNKNFSCKMGEIDLIMFHKEVLIFVEVRMRSRKDYGGALLSVNRAKQLRIIKTAQMYLKKYGAHPPKCRFDVIAIDGNQMHTAKHFQYNDKTYELTWVKNAFNLG
ncbi:YraN family protein [Marinicellulosiphila megalodicopiae]|uniref:YraN family protein n=1 Tax=Marinicellulosiphila megalodicopiae TaxID=2724896 RepID=UPI003BB1873A